MTAIQIQRAVCARQVVSVLFTVLVFALLAGCSSDFYSAVHAGNNAVDSALIWGQSPSLNRDFFVNRGGLYQAALDPALWGHRPMGDGWARSRGEPWE